MIGPSVFKAPVAGGDACLSGPTGANSGSLLLLMLMATMMMLKMFKMVILTTAMLMMMKMMTAWCQTDSLYRIHPTLLPGGA